MRHFAIILATSGLVTACTTTGNVEKNAVIGAAGGAAAGAILGNNIGDGDAETGAIIGAIVGGAGGAMVGHEKDKSHNMDTQMRQAASGQDLIYDPSADRYYFIDPATGRTYWQDGTIRTY